MYLAMISTQQELEKGTQADFKPNEMLGTLPYLTWAYGNKIH